MNSLKFLLIFLFGFGFYFWFDAQYFSLFQTEVTHIFRNKAIGHVAAYSITLIPLVITVIGLHKTFNNISNKFGISNGVFIGIMFAFICTMPMLIAYSVKFSYNVKLTLNTIIINTISSAFFEEIIYRAFLFGQLYRYTRLGFLPSVILGSLLFGLAHLYQSNDLTEIIGIFSLTFLGSVLFSWIYTEWKFNLWTAIFLHCLMNLYWLIFDVDTNALGGIYGNIFRFSTVFLAIGVTVYYKWVMKSPLEVGKNTWWMKKG